MESLVNFIGFIGEWYFVIGLILITVSVMSYTEGLRIAKIEKDYKERNNDGSFINFFALIFILVIWPIYFIIMIINHFKKGAIFRDNNIYKQELN